MEQCKAVSSERDLLRQELSELRTAARVIVNMVDPVKECVSARRTLVEHLGEATQRVANHLIEASK